MSISDPTLAPEGTIWTIKLRKGVQFHKFPDAEKAKWKAKLPNYFDEFIAAQTAKGKGDDARKMVQIWKEVVLTK